MSEEQAIAAGMAEFRRTIRPRLRVHALVLVAVAGLVAWLAKLPSHRIVAVAGLSAVVLWVVLAWIERAWLPANLRDRYRRSGTPQP